MESLTSRLPPPSPAPENPVSDNSNNVAAAIKDIKKAIQSAKTIHPAPVQVTAALPPAPAGGDPWLPRAAELPPPVSLEVRQSSLDRMQEQPLPPLPAPLSSCPPSPACSTPPPPPPVELQDESDSDIGEERVPTPEIMKKEDEDLDTDQVALISINIWRCVFVRLSVTLSSINKYLCEAQPRGSGAIAP